MAVEASKMSANGTGINARLRNEAGVNLMLAACGTSQ